MANASPSTRRGDKNSCKWAGLADDLNARIPISLASAKESRGRWYLGPMAPFSIPSNWLDSFHKALGTSSSLTKLMKAGCDEGRLLTALHHYCNPRTPYLDAFDRFREHFAEARVWASKLEGLLRRTDEALRTTEKYRILRTILDDARLKNNARFLERTRAYPHSLPLSELKIQGSLRFVVETHLKELRETMFDIKRHASASGKDRLDVLLVELLLYIEHQTSRNGRIGRPHYDQVSELLTAATHAFKRGNHFTSESVKRIRQRFESRYPEIYFPMWVFWTVMRTKQRHAKQAKMRLIGVPAG